MSEDQWEVIDEVPGDMQAEIFKGLFEAQGIPVLLSQEGLGHSVYSVGVGALGRVQILVPAQEIERARQLLDDYYSGQLEKEAVEGTEGDEDGIEPEETEDQG